MPETPRLFTVRLHETSSTFRIPKGEFLVSKETATAILQLIAEDTELHRLEGGKLVHPDD